MELLEHEERSQHRYEKLCEKLDEVSKKEYDMEGINSDKVNINLGEGGGGSAGNMAAVIAALGNRNQGSDNAALIAALGNRNDDSNNNLAPLMAAMSGGGGGFGGGMNGILAIAALGLIFGRGGRGGLFGGGGDDCGNGEGRLQDNADTLAILQAISGAKDATVSGFGTSALALSQGFANTKDAVQSLALFQTGQLNSINQNVSDQGCRTRDAVQLGNTAILQAIADNKYEALKNELFEVRTRSHARETEINVSQTVTQAQAQQQQQQQAQRFEDERFRNLAALVVSIGNQNLRNRSDNDTVNFGTMTASGNQAQSTTQVR
jgi:hypothetical protein